MSEGSNFLSLRTFALSASSTRYVKRMISPDSRPTSPPYPSRDGRCFWRSYGQARFHAALRAAERGTKEMLNETHAITGGEEQPAQWRINRTSHQSKRLSTHQLSLYMRLAENYWRVPWLRRCHVKSN